MSLDVVHFTPWSGLAGGALIGLAAILMMGLLGRIAGVSGIAGGLLHPVGGDIGWRLGFVAGLVLGAGLFCAADRCWLAAELPIEIAASPALVVIGGVIVGFGTRLGRGCTSGHGVCGLARLSPRSIAATAVFMTTGALTVFFMRHAMGGY